MTQILFRHSAYAWLPATAAPPADASSSRWAWVVRKSPRLGQVQLPGVDGTVCGGG